MSEYQAKITWMRGADEAYSDNKYSRAHHWHFGGGVIVAATASTQVVPLPYSVAENVDPEEAFIASLSSCHMLFFLDLCSRKGFIIDSYQDDALGIMEKNEQGKIAMTKVTLRPKVIFSGDNIPSISEQEKAHHKSHQLCFIANSVKSEINIEIQN